MIDCFVLNMAECADIPEVGHECHALPPEAELDDVGVDAMSEKDITRTNADRMGSPFAHNGGVGDFVQSEVAAGGRLEEEVDLVAGKVADHPAWGPVNANGDIGAMPHQP